MTTPLDEHGEEAAGDELAAYLVTVPRDLEKRWASARNTTQWRAA